MHRRQGPQLPVDAATSPSPRRPDSDPQLRTTTVDGASYRLLTVPWRDGGAFQIARDLAETESVLDRVGCG